ncbi:hypothetical protein ABFP37_03130 [Burkholderia sp. RS01]|uniref:hypothetical protein n=1 Tax=unclassified Burkholderia TaxID=2613784 RepID=UPI0032181F7F
MTTSQGLAGSVSEYCLGRLEAADGGADADVEGEAAGDADDGGADADAEEDAGAEAAPDAARAEPEAEAEAGAVPVAAEDAGPGLSGVHAARADSPAPATSSLAIDRRLGACGTRSMLGEQS